VTSEPAETARSFYESSSASATIMTLANFPDDVLPLLQMETLTTFETMSFLGCTALVEMGCYDGRALEIARMLGTRYLGVDLDPRAIDTLRARIRREGCSGQAHTLIDDVRNHASWDPTLSGTKPLYLLPFNLLGNFPDPRTMIRSLSATAGAAVISVFGESIESTRTRHSYYSRCGVLMLEHGPTAEGGVLFTGEDGFYSQSYTENGFRSLLVDSGVTVVRMTTNSLGYCATVLLA
jgi:hypothetical protein